MRSIPPRLRKPVRMLVGGSILTVVGMLISGWVAAAFLVPFTVIATAWYYYLGGTDSDLAAVVIGGADERQAYRQLRMQALMGQVLTLAVAIISIVAVAVKATLWPLAILVALIPLTLVAGWVMYRDQPDGRQQRARH